MSESTQSENTPATADAPVLLVEDHDGVRVLTLNRPTKRNALNTALTQALHDALQDAHDDTAVRAVVLTGAGAGFCAGADLREFADLRPEHADRVLHRAKLTCRTQMLLTEIRVPVVSAVHGAAMGGGAGLAIGADATVVADDLALAYPEVGHGIVPALVLTGLQRAIGRKAAFDLVSTGRVVGAEEAVTLGLATEAVPRDQVVEAALARARQWAGSPPQAMAATKELFYRVAELPYAAAMRAGQDVNALMRSFTGASR